MGEDWVKVLSSGDRLHVEILHGMLLGNDIRAIKMNQQDSAYLNIGSIDIYVHRDDVIKANYLIDNIDSK